jgi:hypothetical protein
MVISFLLFGGALMSHVSVSFAGGISPSFIGAEGTWLILSMACRMIGFSLPIHFYLSKHWQWFST